METFLQHLSLYLKSFEVPLEYNQKLQDFSDIQDLHLHIHHTRLYNPYLIFDSLNVHYYLIIHLLYSFHFMEVSIHINLSGLPARSVDLYHCLNLSNHLASYRFLKSFLKTYYK